MKKIAFLSNRIFFRLIVCALAGCATPGSKRDLLNETLDSYAAVIRWGNIEEAVTFVDPETLKAHPLTSVDLARYRQVRVGDYQERPPQPIGENEISQIVEITLSNNNTSAVRSFTDRQVWRYDGKLKRWWLVSGLPDITQR